MTEATEPSGTVDTRGGYSGYEQKRPQRDTRLPKYASRRQESCLMVQVPKGGHDDSERGHQRCNGSGAGNVAATTTATAIAASPATPATEATTMIALASATEASTAGMSLALLHQQGSSSTSTSTFKSRYCCQRLSGMISAPVSPNTHVQHRSLSGHNSDKCMSFECHECSCSRSTWDGVFRGNLILSCAPVYVRFVLGFFHLKPHRRDRPLLVFSLIIHVLLFPPNSALSESVFRLLYSHFSEASAFILFALGTSTLWQRVDSPGIC